MITIEVTQKISAPVEKVCQVLLDHPQLERFFNAKIKTIKIQADGELIGGKGAVRRISIGKIVFEEEIINASNEHICYRIKGNWPVSDHQGDIHLTPQAASLDSEEQTTQLDYVIKFNGPKWLPDFLLKFFVGRDIINAMKKLAEHFETGNCA
ncbi:SRPBCC family protein [Colwellia sp. 75C3]|uniref:SRPBCC family protein n=1 Tax=Colwellia sp. 75C3 TaxID=888425 RepID=UPI001E619188|nr:SRPBCC family protein [Colwellia sp. 75C3]